MRADVSSEQCRFGDDVMQNTLTLAPRESHRLSRSATQLLTCIGGAAAEFAAASLLHFLWEWTRHFLPVAIFASVNESVWEHVKILSWAFLAWSAAEYYILRPAAKRLLIARTAGVLTVAVLTVCFFYVYSGIIGRAVLWIDLVSAALWLLAGEFVSIRVINSPAKIDVYWLFSAAVMTLVVVMLLCFTASAPHIGLFRDPVTGLFGLEKMP